MQEEEQQGKATQTVMDQDHFCPAAQGLKIPKPKVLALDTISQMRDVTRLRQRLAEQERQQLEEALLVLLRHA